MYNQLKVEMYKLRTSRFTFLTIAAFFVFAVMHGYKLVFVDKDAITGYEMYIGAICDTSLIFVLSLFVAYFVGNDFTSRTINNEVQIGYNRLTVILSRGLVILPYAAVLYLFYVIPLMVMVGIFNGFGALSAQTAVLGFLLLALQIMAIQSFTLAIAFICKKAATGIIISVSFTLIMCNIMRNFIKDGEFLFGYTSFYRIMLNSPVLSPSDLLISFVSAIANILVVIYIAYLIFRKAELK